MTNEERFKKYVEENYKNCINKNRFLCDIRVIKKSDGVIETKCNYYKRGGKNDGINSNINNYF